MALHVIPMQREHIGSVRWLFSMMCVEHLAKSTYPHIDEEEIDNFVLALARQLDRSPIFAAWVAVRGRKPVGFLTAEVVERVVGKPNHFFLVHWLYVHPKHREMGCAKQLADAAIEWARQHDLEMVEIYSLTEDTQWLRRGLEPYLSRYAFPLSQAHRLFSPVKPVKRGTA